MKDNFRQIANPSRVRESLHAEAGANDSALPIGRREGYDGVPGFGKKWEAGFQESFHTR